MWGAISRLFHKQNGKLKIVDDKANGVMDRGEKRRFLEAEQDTFESRLAKQRATLKWILSKAFNNKVPENLKEPFYKDHEEQEHLKPQLVHSLASADLYCMALSNIYSDPNYNNLNHCGVLQALARKGIHINDPHITETTLIQTNPIKLSCHQVVMQSVMVVYAKEVVTPELVLGAVRRFNPGLEPPSPQPTDHEQALLLWINSAAQALKQRIDSEENSQPGGCGGKCPEWVKANRLQELCDGTLLSALISFYCPEEVHWSSIRVSSLPTVSDCVRNLSLVANFCSTALPHNVFHMTPEDVYYLRGSMKHNLVVFLADLFNLLEIHPAKCVTLNSATLHNTNGSPIISTGKLKPQITHPIENHSENRNVFYRNGGGGGVIGDGGVGGGGDDESFVIHRGKGVPTLSSIDISGGGSPAKEAAGKPSNWDSNRKQSFAGRRSRRNSLTDDSQLTLENFGGSQENLHLLGRNPDKEPAVHSGRRESSARSSVLDNNSTALHSTLQETLHQQQVAPEAPPRSLSRSNSLLESQRRAEETRSSVGLQSTLLGEPSPPSTPIIDIRPPEREKKVTTFAALPNNTTTWQQQSLSNQNSEPPTDNGLDAGLGSGDVMGSQLMNIRMKLEEKRRRIESDKRRVEAHMNRQRQKLGKAAFLQAVSKGKAVKSPDSDPGSKVESGQDSEPPPRPFSLQDITEVEQKWLRGEGFMEERKTPDLDNMDMETYQQSIVQMNSSLHEIQADLQRLANQQNQIQNPNCGGPQLQSFANLHHQQANYNNQQQSLGYNNQHINYIEYSNGEDVAGSRGFNQASHPPQGMLSLMANAHMENYTGGSQQWHSLNQQPTYNFNPPPLPPRYSQGNGSSGGFSLHQGGGGTSPFHHQQPDGGNVGGYGRGGDESGGGSGGGEFYLHDPPPRIAPTPRRNWSQSPYANSGGDHLHPSSTPPTTTWAATRREAVSLSSSPKNTNFFIQNGGGNDLPPTPPPRASVNHAPIPTPPVDDMEPQSISFIGSGEDELSGSLSRLKITSGNRTYRIPSPTRSHPRNSLSSSPAPPPPTTPIQHSHHQHTPQPPKEQGFYVSLDDEQPKRPKPPLRMKRMSPKKERGLTHVIERSSLSEGVVPPDEPQVMERRVPPTHQPPAPSAMSSSSAHSSAASQGVGIVIGSQPDPCALDEMEKKKERILMLSLQRRQAAEEARNTKEVEAARRRDVVKAREEERLRKKEERERRRTAILEQYKMKKAVEEAEREGKLVDKELLNSLKAGLGGMVGGGGSSVGSASAGPKMRMGKGPTKPRPKTIHIEPSGQQSHDVHDGTMIPSRGKKGSSSNLSVFGAPMRRDYYRGSQDCLTETRKPSPRSLYAEIGDDSRGTSPGRTLARRSSYKTSRDPSPDVRTFGRHKYGTYQAHRKSNSLMNLTGSSCEQDSVYRYGETDSGLGRATPRAPSPSGPGSLPPVRRRFDDCVSDTGSDYSGPRLYKQPTTKSNKGIILNAVEYCVFPGAVNKEAKRRVLEEINRSEVKHFLILFRDAGCQFRALYSYQPDTEEVSKLYGTGPKQVHDRMFDKFFKYNSGGKCFSQVHTKHLTVTIDAFTIHNSLWQGKKVNLPNKRDMTLVI